jgi:hypothetical protein
LEEFIEGADLPESRFHAVGGQDNSQRQEQYAKKSAEFHSPTFQKQWLVARGEWLAQKQGLGVSGYR